MFVPGHGEAFFKRGINVEVTVTAQDISTARGAGVVGNEIIEGGVRIRKDVRAACG